MSEMKSWESTAWKIWTWVWKFIKWTWIAIADLWQWIPKSLIKWVINSADIAWDIAWTATDFTTNVVTWWHWTNIQSKQWFLDKFNKKSDDFLDKQDQVKSILDKSKTLWNWMNKHPIMAGMLKNFWISPEWDKEEVKEEVKKETKDVIDQKDIFPIKVTWWEETKEEIKKEDKEFTQEDFNKQQLEWDKKETRNSFTWELEKNDWYAKEQAWKELDKAKEELEPIKQDILSMLKSGEITKDEARQMVILAKTAVSWNFDSSISDNLRMKWIEWTFENRKKIAEAIWLEDYKWTYDQNIKMLELLKYKNSDEINSLLGNK